MEIIIRIRRKIRRRKGEDRILGIEIDMEIELGLEEKKVIEFKLRRKRMIKIDVRSNEIEMDRIERRSVIKRSSKKKRKVLEKRDDCMKREIEEGMSKEKSGEEMIMKRKGKDLRGNGRKEIDKKDKRIEISKVKIKEIEKGKIMRIEEKGGKDIEIVEEGIGKGKRMIKKEERIEKKVEKIEIEIVRGKILMNVIDRIIEVLRGMLGKRDDKKIEKIIIKEREKRIKIDNGEIDIESDRIVGEIEKDSKLDWRKKIEENIVKRVGKRKEEKLM